MTLAHPSYDMISAYATGVATQGVSLLVAAHATYCPDCRAEIARIEALSGALLREASPDEMSPDRLDAALAMLDAPEFDSPERDAPEQAPLDAAEQGRSGFDGMLPRPVVEAFGRFPEIRWRFLIPGVSRVELPSEGHESVSLLRVRPGSGIPSHTHTAEEATLVLSGALNDRGRVFARGDVAMAGRDDDHRPRAEPGADCVCLAVMSGTVRFTGTFGRALNIFAE